MIDHPRLPKGLSVDRQLSILGNPQIASGGLWVSRGGRGSGGGDHETSGPMVRGALDRASGSRETKHKVETTQPTVPQFSLVWLS
jgi:hypothetical protein